MSFSVDAFDTDAFDNTAFEIGAQASVYFQGTVPSDGGTMFPPRADDPRWAQFITDSGITPSNNFIDDVMKALEVATGEDRISMQDMWKKVKNNHSLTDISEPFTY